MLKLKVRSGFTLAEVIVSFALVAVMAAVTVPTIRGRLQESYEDTLASELDNLSTAITAYRQDVGKYPPSLDYLSALPATPKDRCNITLSATAQANWRGPYVSHQISSFFSYYFVAQKDSVKIVIGTATPFNGLAITVQGADTLTVHDLDLKYDGLVAGNLGVISYTGVNATGDETFQFNIPTKANSC